MIKDKEDKRAATREAMRRYREKQKVSHKGITLNEALIKRLASPIGEAKLMSICRCLNKSVASVNLGDGKTSCNLLDMVNYGINHPVSTRAIFDLLTSTGTPKQAK